MTKDDIKQLVMDYQGTFGSEEGRRVLADLSKQCYADALTFVPGSPDGTAFNEGKRYVILHIQRLVAANLNQIGESNA